MIDSTEKSYLHNFIISGSVGRDSTKGAGYLLLLSGNVFPPRKNQHRRNKKRYLAQVIRRSWWQGGLEDDVRRG